MGPLLACSELGWACGVEVALGTLEQATVVATTMMEVRCFLITLLYCSDFGRLGMKFFNGLLYRRSEVGVKALGLED